MTDLLLPALLLGPLVAAAAVLLAPRARGVVATLASAGVLAAAVGLLVVTADGTRIVLAVGDHLPPLGIVLVGDVVAAIAATASAAVLLAVQLALRGTPADRWPATRATTMLLTTGVLLAFTTADLFTMFVAFEIVLFASYTLLTRDGDRRGVRAAPAYVLTNLVASAVFLLAIAGVYAATGHVNMAAVAAAWPEVDPALRTLLTSALALVFATKAALVPLGAWLPGTYATLPPAVGAAAAALLTKVGVVALVRLVTLLEPGPATSQVLLVVAVTTMLGGVVVALGESSLHRVLSAHVISQVGFMVVGVALFDVAGLAAALLYLAHHILVKAALLLVAAGVVARTGTLRLADLRGLQRTAPVLGGLFLLGAAALAGLPPTSGFVAKLALLQAGIDAGAWLAVGGMALASTLTLVSMAKVHGALLGDRDGPVVPRAEDGGAAAMDVRAERGAIIGATGLLATAVAVSVFAGPLHDVALVGAERAFDVRSFIAEVLP